MELSEGRLFWGVVATGWKLGEEKKPTMGRSKISGVKTEQDGE